MSFFKKLFGDPNEREVKRLRAIVETKITPLAAELETISDEALKEKTASFRARLAEGATLNDLLPEAFAVVRETSRRVLGQRQYDVQLLGGVALHHGTIAEMRTGEGKTLVATLPTYLNALTGKGVHVVTVNDYLAKRDAVWMGQIYDFLGLTVGIIQNQTVSYRYSPHVTPEAPETKDVAEGGKADKERDEKGAYKVEYEYLVSCTRQDAYKCDIVYGTNNEFGFDYLRDNMVQDLESMVQRGLNFAVVDEVDSILIDEARTPLIISAPAEKAADIYYKFADLVEKLTEHDDFAVDEKMRSATMTDAGLHKMEGWLGIENIYAEGGMSMVHHMEQALRAKALFKRDRDYVVEGGEVIIVDEFTGRKMPGRRYNEGLHQAIEAKEKVAIQRESQTMATVTFQNYFRMYTKLSGMTGTAVTEAEELGKIYKLEVVVIPTNRKAQRTDHPDRIYKNEAAKYQAIAKTVRALQEKGQPVLIGTISVEKNELLSRHLELEGIKHEILNAKNHEREGEIVAQAGREGAVTIATNMAGRGVDIILGGNPPDKDQAEKVRSFGGLFVIGTERHESRRIDNQLRGRAGRQGDPGETQFYLSTDDDLMRIFAGERIKKAMQMLKIPDDMPIEQKSITRIIESAQKKVEGFHFDTRKHLLEYDDIINRHREVVYGKRRAVLESFATEKKALDPSYTLPQAVSEVTRPTLRAMVFEMIDAEIEQIVSYHTNAEDRSSWNLDDIISTLETIFPLSALEKEKIKAHTDTGTQKMEAVEFRESLAEEIIKMAHEKYDTMLVQKAHHAQVILEIEKQMLLRSIDNLWVEHLVSIDYLRTGIGLRGYGQRDPLVEYKRETYRMFSELLSAIQKEVVYSIYKLSIGIQMAPSVMESGNVILQGAQKEEAPAQQSAVGPAQGAKEVGRNEPCYCGSGKKYKKCHGA
jgi:preprotein translocase subunit SecA